MKRFKLTKLWFNDLKEPEFFTEETAPSWLCDPKTRGTTMDNMWFWEGHVLTLEVGQTAETDFSRIERVE